jgi:glycosyltransferase involved in cell wall biosynthesis
MYPSKEKPYSGLFVVNQVKAIQDKLNEDDILDFYYMKRTFTNKIGSIIKYIKFFCKFIFFAKHKKYKYDIIHIHYYFPTIYIAMIYKYFFNKKVKIFVTFHGFDLYRTKKNFLFKYPLRSVDVCIGVSGKMCNGISKYYSGKIYNISAGINNIFEKQDCQKQYDLIFVGSFYEEKGFDRLCDYLLKTKDILSVCIIGSGYLEVNLKKVFVKTSHNIEVYNNLEQQEIVKYLNKSKLLLNLSREESFGLSMTEAMTCGVPVIATQTDGSLEQVNHKVNGILLQMDQTSDKKLITELDVVIHRLIFLDNKEMDEMSMNALQDSQKYKLSSVSKQVISIYKEVII